MKQETKIGDCEYGGCDEENVTLYQITIWNIGAPNEKKWCCVPCVRYYNSACAKL